MLELLSGLRPMKSYLDMLRKLLDCDGLMMLVKRSQTLSLKNRIRRLDKDSILALAKSSRASVQPLASWYRHWVDRQLPPFESIRAHRDLYFTPKSLHQEPLGSRPSGLYRPGPELGGDHAHHGVR